jgi:glycosyltransferase involved in cell wall biosynthesis
MKIIIVGMVNSIHLVRWVEHLYNYKKLEILIFPVFPARVHPRLLKILNLSDKKSNIKIAHLLPWGKLNFWLLKFMNFLFKSFFFSHWLNFLIKKTNPEYIHSHELSTSSILCLKARLNFKGTFPKWIVTNWGSDLYFFYKKKKFKENLKKVLQLSNFYSAECRRDYKMAKKIGLKATFLDCVTNSGGIPLQSVKKINKKQLTSSRKIILIKGYHGLFGLALNSIKAIQKISQHLREYTIVVYSADQIVVDYCNSISKKLDLKFQIYSNNTNLTQKEMYGLFSKAKVYIGISKSDGISTSLLESMALGAFPIQSNTSCANEWILNNKTGYILPPYNIKLISKKILLAINNDKQVDLAAKLNWKTIVKRADSNKIKKIIRKIYK